MKRVAAWVVPGLLAMTAIVSACSSSEDPLTDDTPGDDAGPGTKDGSTSDSGTDAADTGTDAKDDADSGDEGPPGPPDDYMIACARIDACATATTPRMGMNACYALVTAAQFPNNLDAKERALLESLDCKLKATTCAEVNACDRPKADYTAFCQEREGGDHCDGNVHVVCSYDTFEPLVATDCAANGKLCGGEGGFYAGCGIAPCDVGETESTCNGAKLTTCAGFGLTQELDCKTTGDFISMKPAGKMTIAGTTCGKNGDGPNECMGEGAECSGFSQKCDGTVLETCAGGKVARRDCAQMIPAGQGCVVLSDGPDYIHGVHGCGPVNPTCQATDNETCNPSTGIIGFCGLTGPKKIDCKALGYAGCKTTTVAGRMTAACFQ